MNVLFYIIFANILLLFYKLKYGVCLYTFIFLMLPYLNITEYGIHLSFNVLSLILIIALLYDFKYKHSYKVTYKLFIPFIFLYLSLLILTPFQFDMPMGIMFSGWIVTISNCFVLSFVISNVLFYYPNSNKYYHLVVILIISIASIYGLFLMIFGEGINPYQMMMAYINEVDVLDDYYVPTDDRIFGRISSVFQSPQAFGIFLCMSLIYLLSFRNKINKCIFAFIFVLLVINVIGCGVRTAIVTSFVCGAYYLSRYFSVKLVVWTMIVCLIGGFVITQSPWLEKYIASSVNVKKTDETQGSSLSMRLSQFEGCLDEISSCPLQGKGFCWHAYYREKKDYHPVLLHFESLLFMILCDNGVLGLFIWFYFTILYLRKSKGPEKVYLEMMLLGYYTYTLITGDYGYMKYLSLFYVLLFYGTNELSKESQSKNNRILSSSVSPYSRK